MKIPKQLKVGGHIIKVDSTSELPGEDGSFSSRENMIRICKLLPQSQKEMTLIHEILHSLNSTFHQGDKHTILDSLAEQLYQVLSDNKMLK